MFRIREPLTGSHNQAWAHRPFSVLIAQSGDRLPEKQGEKEKEGGRHVSVTAGVGSALRKPDSEDLARSSQFHSEKELKSLVHSLENLSLGLL